MKPFFPVVAAIKVNHEDAIFRKLNDFYGLPSNLVWYMRRCWYAANALRGKKPKRMQRGRITKTLKVLKCLLALWLMSGQSFVFATSIVAFRTPDEVVVAADSMVIARDKDGNEKKISFCKIIPLSDHMFFAAAGTIRIGGTTIDVMAAVRELQNDPDFKDMLQSFQGAVGAITFKMLWRINNSLAAEKTRSDIRKELDRGALFDFIVFGVNSGIPVLWVQRFKPAHIDAPDAEIKGYFATGAQYVCPGEGCPNGISELVRLGRVKAIDAFIDSHQTRAWNLSLTDSTRFLVSLEAIDEPDLVGTPIVSVRLTKDGKAEWINKCEEPKKPEPKPAPKPAPKPTKRRHRPSAL